METSKQNKNKCYWRFQFFYVYRWVLYGNKRGGSPVPSLSGSHVKNPKQGRRAAHDDTSNESST